MNDRVNNVNEWMEKLTEAVLDAADVGEDGVSEDVVEVLEDLESTSRGWLQTDEEKEAQLNLLDAVRELMDTL